MIDDDHWLSHLLLGHEGRQMRDIRRLRAEAAVASDQSATNSARVIALQQRVDRLELVCETLLHLVLQRGLVDRDELARIMARIDLRDGFEDGRVSSDEPLHGAPLCTTCDLPINPRREACVYCGAAVARPAKAAAPSTPRLVTCTKCNKEVDESRTLFTGNGLCCEACHAAG